MISSRSKYYSYYESKHWNMIIFASDEGITNTIDLPFEFDESKYENKENEHIRLLKEELDRYYDGEMIEFTVKLDLEGTSFQKKVWEAAAKIPYGKIITYLDLAMEVGGKNYTRAVGGALGRNPVGIVVP